MEFCFISNIDKRKVLKRSDNKRKKNTIINIPLITFSLIKQIPFEYHLTIIDKYNLILYKIKCSVLDKYLQKCGKIIIKNANV